MTNYYRIITTYKKKRKHSKKFNLPNDEIFILI